jgi:hypothetical protein
MNIIKSTTVLCIFRVLLFPSPLFKLATRPLVCVQRAFLVKLQKIQYGILFPRVHSSPSSRHSQTRAFVYK